MIWRSSRLPWCYRVNHSLFLLCVPWLASLGGWPFADLSLLPLSLLLSWAGIPENSKVEGPAFTDAIRMYRQSKEQYGTWEMLCGNEVQVRSGGCLRGPQGHPGAWWVRLHQE